MTNEPIPHGHGLSFTKGLMAALGGALTKDGIRHPNGHGRSVQRGLERGFEILREIRQQVKK